MVNPKFGLIKTNYIAVGRAYYFPSPVEEVPEEVYVVKKVTGPKRPHWGGPLVPHIAAIYKHQGDGTYLWEKNFENPTSFEKGGVQPHIDPLTVKTEGKKLFITRFSKPNIFTYFWQGFRQFFRGYDDEKKSKSNGLDLHIAE